MLYNLSHMHTCLEYAPLTIAALFGVAVAFKVIQAARAAIRKSRFAAEAAACKPGSVVLYAMPRTSTLLQVSSPCLKVETVLRLGRVPYTIHCSPTADDSPTLRAPYAVISGQIVTDSEFIIKKIVELRLGHAAGLDGSLTKEQAALGQALKRMLDGDFERGVIRAGLVDNMTDVRTHIVEAEFGMRFPFSLLFARMIRKSTIDQLNASGFGDLTDQQYVAATLDDARAIEAMIEKHCYFGAAGTKKYILGTPQPTSYDAAVFAALYTAVGFTTYVGAGKSELLDYLRASEPMRDYIDALKAIAFPDEAEVLAGHKASEQRFTH